MGTMVFTGFVATLEILSGVVIWFGANGVFQETEGTVAVCFGFLTLAVSCGFFALIKLQTPKTGA